MCEESAFVLFHSGGERHLDDVDVLEVADGSVALTDMKGNETLIKGHIRLIDLVNRRIEIA